MTSLFSYLAQYSRCVWFSKQGQGWLDGWQHGLSVVGAFTNQKLRGSTVPSKVLRWNETPAAWTSASEVAQSTNTPINSDTGNKIKGSDP